MCVCILNQILHVSVVNVAAAPKISGLYPKPEARVSAEQLWKEITSRLPVRTLRSSC